MDHQNARARASVIRALFLFIATALVAAFGVAPAQATAPRQSDAAPVAATPGDATESTSSAIAATDDRAESAGAHHLPAAAPEAARPLIVLLPVAEPADVSAGAPRSASTTACGRAPPA